jgi:hypothetical protein
MTLGVSRRVTAVAVLWTWIGGVLLQAVAPHVPDTADFSSSDRVLSGRQPTPKPKIERSPAVTEGRCAVCHLQREVRSAVPTAARTIAYVSIRTGDVVVSPFRVEFSHVDNLPSRAPPARVVS